MEITVNSQILTLTDPLTIAQLLSVNLRLPQTGLAVAVNQLVITKNDWSVYQLCPGDQVVLIRATQGG